jgi:DNA repair protein RadA/Sms
MKTKTAYICEQCGAKTRQWRGQCSRCEQWGTLKQVLEGPDHGAGSPAAKDIESRIFRLQELPQQEEEGLSTGSAALDGFFGQGLVPGSSILLGGEPGVGKSTFLLQMAGALAGTGRKTLYVTGEESLAQLKRRAERLRVLGDELYAMSTARLEEVLQALRGDAPPGLLVVDSVQTMVSEASDGIAGSVSQVRTVASGLQEAAKDAGTVLVLVGHVTKEGQIAGPKLLEHTVDTVLYLEGDKQHFFRILRVSKNRFGPASNILVLEMASQGLHIVRDPSTFFLQARDPSLSGTGLIMAMEGQRSFAVEIQALASKSFLSIPRRTALGLDTNRLHLLLAIMERKLRINFGQTDVYAKIGGGLRLQEPGMDLGLVAALLSSYYDRALPEKGVFWGEVDLSGQVRPVWGQDQRLKQARALGYSPVVCPPSSGGKSPHSKDVRPVSTVFEMQRALFGK